jgi:hypothetical protein
VLKRNADIEELSMRTEHLDESSSSYRLQTQAVKKKMVWKNRKWAVILGCCCILLVAVRSTPLFSSRALVPHWLGRACVQLGIYVIAALICGWTFSSCS